MVTENNFKIWSTPNSLRRGTVKKEMHENRHWRAIFFKPYADQHFVKKDARVVHWSKIETFPLRVPLTDSTAK